MYNKCVYSKRGGAFPNTFPLWLSSVENNPSIDFLFITNKHIENIPKNVRLILLGLKDVKALAEQKIGMSVSLERPYKLCDFKPAYGKIFEDYLCEYDYWGHCDLDMIFGDIRAIVSENNLKYFDKFFNEGHLSLYRNSPDVNNAYKLYGSYYDYKLVFSRPQNYCFDERNKINSIFEINNFKLYNGTLYANINPAFTKFILCRLKNYWYQIFVCEDGKIFRYYLKHNKLEREEFAYIHLLKRNLPLPDFDIDKNTKYLISDAGYKIINADITKDFLKDEIIQYSRLNYLKQWIVNFYNFRLKISSIKRQFIFFLWKRKWGRRLIQMIHSKNEI